MNQYKTLSETYLDRNAWSPFFELKKEVEQMLERSAGESWTPPCEFVEDASHYLLSLELAGVPKDQIQIDVTDQTLTVSGERKAEFKKKEHGSLYSERSFGKFSRKFSIPTGVEMDRIEAEHENGVLTLFIPKSEKTKARQIKINSGESTGLIKNLKRLIHEKPPNEIAS